MPTTKVNSLLKDIKGLSVSDYNDLITLLSGTSIASKSSPIADRIQKERNKNGRVCPICGSDKVKRNGKKDSKQRYRCNNCNKTFMDTTNSIFSGSSKDEAKWAKYFECMINGYSIRKCADIVGISVPTAFQWRHKILDALTVDMENDTVSGIVEADETFFRESYKGNHKNSKSFSMPRTAKKRGTSASFRGLSHEQICVPCALDRNGMVISKIACRGRISSKQLTTVYENKIAEDSTLITDKLNSYVRFAHKQGIELVQLKNKAKIKGKKGSPAIIKGIYHIQNINSYHSGLKLFMDDFKGVSTKHLNNYLIWYKWLKMNQNSISQKPNAMMKDTISALHTTKIEDISNRPAVPVLNEK